MTNESIEYLREHLTVRGVDEAAVFLAHHSRKRVHGSALLVFLDSERRFADLWVVDDGADDLPEILRLACEAEDVGATSAFVATDRTGEVPADRPDDELSWLELHAVAARSDIDLLDWFVLWGDKAFSVAEHAPIRAGW